jgi:hypothetical protein
MESNLNWIPLDPPRRELTISVAIATYNRAAMVPAAIRAALEQSRAPLEVVVADDASSDATVSVVRQLAERDGRVKLLRQSKNTGGVENWNAAIEATCGDLYRAGHLQASAAYLEAHPNVGWVHSGFADWIDSPEGTSVELRPLRRKKPFVLHRKNLFWYLLRYYDWPFHPSTIVMRRRVWEDVGRFDPTYALADTDWFVRAAKKHPVALLPRYGVNNRRHPGNWSNRLGSVRMQEEIAEIMKKEMGTEVGKEIGKEMGQKMPSAFGGLRSAMWRQAWRANTRLHLLLTVRARLRTGHADAACAAWRALFTKGAQRSWWLVEAGEEWLRDRASRVAAGSATPRQRVSPL